MIFIWLMVGHFDITKMKKEMAKIYILVMYVADFFIFYFIFEKFSITQSKRDKKEIKIRIRIVT